MACTMGAGGGGGLPAPPWGTVRQGAPFASCQIREQVVLQPGDLGVMLPWG